MKKMISITSKIGVFMYLLFLNCIAWAQDKAVEINEPALENWFQRNWVWVAVAAVVLLALIFSGGRRIIRTTTTYRKDDGTVTKTKIVEDK
jgi:hypothetical protein